MALVVFSERIDFNSITLPEQGGYIVGYNIENDLLSQMDYQGIVTPIGGVGSAGTLFSTLSLGNTTGTYSIVLDSSITKGTNKISLDSGIVSLTTDNGSYGESYLYLNSGNVILGNGSCTSFRIENTGITTKWSETDRQIINTDSYELFLNNFATLQFGQLSSGAGSKLSGLMATDNSTIDSGLVNTVVIGGQNINATQNNSVYVPFLLIQDGKVIKGTKGSGQIKFTNTGDVISSNDNNVIGLVSSTSSVIFTQNGIFIKDSATASSTPDIDSGITYVSSRNSSATASIKNSVVIGGQGLVATQDNTVYIGNNVNINNAFRLPTADGSIGQVMKTDGSGNVTWGRVSSTLNLVTLNYSSFVSLGGVFEVDTAYIITNADTGLYGGTEIYLTTNSNGILNDEGIGKFYNPNYTTAPGFGIFSTSSTYAINSTAIWGGYFWTNATGTHTSPTNLFELNGLDLVDNWTRIPFDKVYYTISYDKIKYDWSNDLIIYRNENNTNIVSTSKLNIDTIKSINSLFNPIKSFQWGNLYNIGSGKGIGSQNIINSYNENINFRGKSQVNITMNNLSAQYNLVMTTTVSQNNIIFNNYLYNRLSLLLSSDENGLVFQGDLPNTTPSKIMGKVNNQQVEIDLSTTSLVTPVIISRWNIFKYDGTTTFGPTAIDGTTIGTFSTSNTLTVPFGCKVSYTGTSSIPAATTGLSTPSTITGSYSFTGSTYPLVSATLSTTGLSSITTYTTTITKPKTGLIVSGSQVIAATGSDTLSVSAQVTFSYLFYFGYLNVGLPGITITQGYVDGVTASQIEGLGNYKFGGKSQTFVSNDGGAGSRLVFAYPATLGLLTSLTYTGSTVNSLGAFTIATNTVTITTISGNLLPYYVYVANADNTWGNGTTITITTT
jgi:hypothetical protein